MSALSCALGASLAIVPVAHVVKELADNVLAADLAGAWELVINRQHELLLAAAMVLLLVCWALRRYSGGQVYLLDFAVTKAPDSWRMPRARFLRLLREHSELEPEEIDFQDRMLQRSGLGPQETCATPGILTHNSSLEYCRAEFMELCFSAIEEVLAKTGVKPHQIGFIVTNSSLFNPTPSLSATIINRFKLPETTINYSLGGMGCSAGVVALDLAKQMLRLHPNTYALVVSHENITNAWYDGHDRTMMVPNCLFRANGSAVLLSNHAKDSGRAKYRLQHLVRTILAADDEAFKCIHQVEDAENKLGVSLRKELVTVAGRALKANLTRLGPKVLPLREKAAFGANLVLRQLGRTCRPLGARLPAWATKPYVPNFGAAFNHMCIHTGGRGVLDGIEKQLGLSDAAMLPSRAALFRFGNTSSTSIWYVLAYLESFQGIKRGDKVWQLGFGSGFKCNSAVWVANRKVRDLHRAWDGYEAGELAALMDTLAQEKAAYLAAKAAAGTTAGSGASSGAQ